MSFYHFTLASANRKTGPIPTTVSSPDTCPDACPLKKNGCYADSGPLAMHWRRVAAGITGKAWKVVLESVSRLPRHQLWRHNVAGDLAGANNRIDFSKLKELVKANRGRNGFTYTHKPVLASQGAKIARHNRETIKFANANGFAINLSANNINHADKLKALGIAPVVTILPEKVESNTIITPKGNKIIVCPATYMDNVTCQTCKLCANISRSVIIGFPAHGTSKKKAELAFNTFSK